MVSERKILGVRVCAGMMRERGTYGGSRRPSDKLLDAGLLSEVVGLGPKPVVFVVCLDELHMLSIV